MIAFNSITMVIGAIVSVVLSIIFLSDLSDDD